MPDIELVRLIYADVFRDGGSFGASFETEDGRLYNVWLQRSKMPDREGRHHRWLFEYIGPENPENPLPIITGSTEDSALIGRLKRFLEERADDLSSQPGASLARLRELIGYIEQREPCLPADLCNRRFHIPRTYC